MVKSVHRSKLDVVSSETESGLLSQCQRQLPWLTSQVLLHLFPAGFMRILSCNEAVN